MKIHNTLASLLLVVGSSAMLAHIAGWTKLKGLALASCIAPYTKVFCSAQTQDGEKIETFSNRLELQYHLADGSTHRQKITPDTYQNIKGPYQRRNVYGAVLAYGPALPRQFCQHTLDYAFSPSQGILNELNIPLNASDITLKIVPTSSTPQPPWILRSNLTKKTYQH